MKMRRVLHATDFSTASSRAFKRAVDIAKASGAELLLVHVLPSVFPVVADGYVSITPLHMDLTNYSLIETVRGWRLEG